MAAFAEIDALKKVIRVLALDDKDTQDKHGNEVEAVGVKYLNKAFGGTWLRTSYNTAKNTHKLVGTPFRKNFAGIGFTYDETRDAFIPPQNYPSWTLNEDTCIWEAPVAYPADGKVYEWNELDKSWVEF